MYGNKWVIWGLARHPQNTFYHIHFAFERALRYLGKEVHWLNDGDDLSKIDLSGAIFLSMNCVFHNIPKRDDCWYVVHNAQGDPCQSYFDGLKLLPYGIHVTENSYGSQVLKIGPEIYFDPTSPSLLLRWGTDLLPHEIEANKPTRVFNSDSTVINYVGSVDSQKSGDLNDFGRACRENGIEFRQFGGYNNGRIVSLEEHIQLVKDSYMSPAFQGKDQIKQGYTSCRLPKALSYGQMGITPSIYMNQLFDNRLICNPDCYQLFYDAKERLQSMPLSELHSLMNLVARDHTYLNKIAGIEKAISMLENS